jgi:heme-degrading monooxygenase HmoA
MSAFRVMLRMQIKPGAENEFERVWASNSGTVTGHPANRGHSLSRSAEEDGVYYIISDWTDEPEFRTYEHSAEHLEHRAKLHPYRSGGSMTTMRVVRHSTVDK